MTSFELDQSWRRFERLLVAGSPLRIFRLGGGGERICAALEAGAVLPAGHEALTDRLVACGALHPLPSVGPLGVRHDGVASPCDVTVVVPSLGSPAIDEPDGAAVVLVDDASDPPLVAADGVRLVRRSRNGGPGAARNTGLATIDTPFVAFVDADVCLPAGWLAPLLVHFSDPAVAIVAPRVRSSDDPRSGVSLVLAEYEREASPLDMGGSPARVMPGSRVSYLPAATIVCRTEAIRQLGGFDETMRFGEDVDLVWRAVAAGWTVRFEPRSVVTHRPRPTWTAWARQRVGYGTSAAPLSQRHCAAVAPFRASGWSAAVIGAVLARRPLAAAGLVGVSGWLLRRKVSGLPAGEAARLVVTGHGFALEQAASAVRRVWLPLAAILALVVPRSRLALAAAVVVAPLARAGHPQRAALRVADDLCYSVGVWWGMWRQRTLTPLRPQLGSWPPKRDER